MLQTTRTCRVTATVATLLLYVASASILPTATYAEEDRQQANGSSSQEGDASPQQIAQWIQDLGSSKARAREKATAALIRSGHAATASVAEAAGSSDFEVAFRAFRILSVHLSSQNVLTQTAAEEALAKLVRSDDTSVARRATNTLHGLLARRQSLAVAALQSLGATVEFTGELGDAETTFAVRIENEWSGDAEDYKTLTRLQNLQSLHVQVYRGGEAAIDVLPELPALRYLSLYHLNPTREQVAKLGQLTQVQSLDLTSSMIDDEAVRHLAKMTNLTELSLRDTIVTGDAISHLRTLPKLRWISLASTRLTAAEFEQLAGLKNLEFVEVSGTQFRGASLQALASLKKLQTVSAQQARLSRYDVEDFSELRENVNVVLRQN